MLALYGTAATFSKRESDPLVLGLVGAHLLPSKPPCCSCRGLPLLPPTGVPFCQQKPLARSDTLTRSLPPSLPPSLCSEEEPSLPSRRLSSRTSTGSAVLLRGEGREGREGRDEPSRMGRASLRAATAMRGAIAAACEKRPPSEEREGGWEDASEMVAEQRLKTLRRLRDRREQRERMEEGFRRQEVTQSTPRAEARSGARLREARLQEEVEGREAFRAEVYAINRMLAGRDEAAFAAYVEERRGELEGIELRHQQEAESRRKESQQAESIFREKLRQAEREVRAEKAREKREAEAAARREEARKEEARRGEAEREIRRAQAHLCLACATLA
ncbi:MAG: hypothetical protein SGPRY_008271 [Prymnesium sp.]